MKGRQLKGRQLWMLPQIHISTIAQFL